MQHPALKAFLTHLEKASRYSAHTLSAYERDLRHYFEKTQASLHPTKEAARAYLMSLSELDYAPKTRARKLAALRSFWQFLIREKQASENPWRQLRQPKLGVRLPRAVAKEKMAVFLDNFPLITAQNLRDKAIFEMLYATGMRVSELTGLTLSRLNLAEGECRVMGKGARERVVIFGAAAQESLQHYLQAVRPKWQKRKTEAVFLSQKGTPLSSRSVERLLKSYLAKQGFLFQATPHSFRHSVATDLLDSGANLRWVQTFLGHKNLSSTQVYTKVSIEKLIETHKKAHPRGH